MWQIEHLMKPEVVADTSSEEERILEPFARSVELVGVEALKASSSNLDPPTLQANIHKEAASRGTFVKEEPDSAFAHSYLYS